MGVDVGQMIIAGALMSVPILIAALLYAHWIGKKIYQIPREDGTYDRKGVQKEYLKTMDQLDEIMGGKRASGLGESLCSDPDSAGTHSEQNRLRFRRC